MLAVVIVLPGGSDEKNISMEGVALTAPVDVANMLRRRTGATVTETSGLIPPGRVIYSVSKGTKSFKMFFDNSKDGCQAMEQFSRPEATKK